MLENVDRPIKSPAKQRGRDFAIIISCLNNMGYAVEWRVINADRLWLPQRRRRIFIFATLLDTPIGKRYIDALPHEIMIQEGLFAQTFAVASNKTIRTIPISTDLLEITKSFSTPFSNAGFAVKHLCHTSDLTALAFPVSATLGSVLERDVDERFYIKSEDLEKWEYMKGSKNEMRQTREGYQYNYTEGAIPYPEPLDRPSRTMLTSESSKNRSTHVIKDPQTGKLRLLTPVECERLNGFPDNWTNTGMPEKSRYFCMGNALVVGLIEMMGKTLLKMMNKQ